MSDRRADEQMAVTGRGHANGARLLAWQAERVKKVEVLGEEWLPDSEVLTPTSKLKRRGIHSRYAEEIESLYVR